MATRRLLAGLTFAASMMVGVEAEAGYFATITIDNAFGDWAGVPVVDIDAGDNFVGPDIADTQIANDGQNLYIRNTFANNVQLSTYLAIDTDQNAATGFDVLGLGLIGTEAAWQNDFGFSQDTGSFNTGPLLGANFFGAGHGLLAPFGNFASREMAISLSVQHNGGLAVFPGDTVRLVFFTESGTGADGLPAGVPGDDGQNWDVTGVITYTLAPRTPVPEPAALALLATAAAGAWFRRRSR